MHVKKLFSLKEKCAVVIGGSGKIGFPMAEALAEAGAKVSDGMDAIKKSHDILLEVVS